MQTHAVKPWLSNKPRFPPTLDPYAVEEEEGDEDALVISK